MKNTKRSFHFAIVSSILVTVFTMLSQITRTVSNSINDGIGYLMTLFFITIIAGVVYSFLSFRESYHWKKYVAIGINFFFFIMTSIALMGRVKDILEAFG
ncbi:MAG: hypothetical protein ACJAXY_001855 [Nonlabens sp.]|jgi:hypothetical protein|uniref:hypothetical protein n=1 Tax=Nonlabens sp. TaxID=1888209 RepID=UPI0039E71086